VFCASLSPSREPVIAVMTAIRKRGEASTAPAVSSAGRRVAGPWRSRRREERTGESYFWAAKPVTT
jgi:hypothetical protein